MGTRRRKGWREVIVWQRPAHRDKLGMRGRIRGPDWSEAPCVAPPPGSSAMPRAPRWASLWLHVAAAYNLLWGAWVIAFPTHYFTLVGMDPPRYPELWQCVGMIVGVYGIGYAVAARDPLRHWPIVLVGLLGKVLGPIGFLQAILKGPLPWGFGWTLLTNDLVWWVPFAMILWRAFEASGRSAMDDAGGDYRSLVAWWRSSHGRTLAQHFADGPHLVVFTRHFGCTFCREALAELGRVRDRIETAGTRLLVVHTGTQEKGEAVLNRYGLQGVAHVSDAGTAL
jgi:hypothetical protein